MCEFLSWIEKDNKAYFLTYDQIYNSDRGKELREYNKNDDDLIGHGAIRWFYELEGGINKECSDFLSPKNFPPEMVIALKDGKFRGLGVARGLLLDAKCKLLVDDYDAKLKPLTDDYDAKLKPLTDDYNARFWDLFADSKNRRKAWR